MNAMKPTNPKKFEVKKEEVKIEPLMIKKTLMSRDGLFELQFNQDTIVPQFGKNTSDNGRKLVEMNSFDLSKVFSI